MAGFSTSVQVKERVNFHRDIYRSLVKNLMIQRDLGEFCDITLRVNGRRFFAHKAVLAAGSPYFRSMFTSRMKEETSLEIDLSESLLVDSHASFKHILDYLYCGEIDITVDNAEDILRIADFLLLEEVKDYCRQFFLQYGNLNLSNSICIAFLAEHHNLPEVAYVAKSIVKSRFHDYLIFSEELLEVPESCFKRLLQDQSVTKFTSGDSLVRGILRWIVHDRNERKHCLLPLLNFVPIQSLSSDCARQLLAEPAVKCDSLIIDKLQAVQSTHGDTACSQQMSPPVRCDGEFTDLPPEDVPVLIAASCSQPFHYIKVVLYCPKDQMWYEVPFNGDSFMHALPPRLSIASMTLRRESLFMFLCHHLPYPSDMQRVYVMELDLTTASHRLHVFRHHSTGSLCCQTTLTDDHSVPPVIVFCNRYLCLVGNREGTGHLFLCNMGMGTYCTYQIPGVRFISLARALVRGDRYIFIWARHRFGHEEYCINKEVTFVCFDCEHMTFSTVIPAPPGVAYTEFAAPHIMCLQGESVVLHIPGKSSLILDETHNEWLTFQGKLPPYPNDKIPPDLPYRGYQVYTATPDSNVYVIQNPTAYATTLTCLSDEGGCKPRTPPPVDSISLLTSGTLPVAVVTSFPQCLVFDDTYTRLVYNRSTSPEYDTSGSVTPHSPSDSDDDYEYDDYQYDDDIYGLYDDFEIQ